MSWLWTVAFTLAFGYAAWFFLSGESIGSVRGTVSGPWGRTYAPRVTVRRGGNGVRVILISPIMGVTGMRFSRAEALQLADALEKAAHEAVS